VVRRKDGRWQETVKLPGMDKPKYFYGKTKAEVLSKIRGYEIERENGPLLDDLANEWLEWKTPQVRYKTSEGYIAPLKDIKAHFADTRVKDITPPKITAFIHQIAKKHYARRTVQARLDVLNMIFSYAISEKGVLDINPCAEVSLPSGIKNGSRELASEEDIAAIIAHKEDSRFAYLPFFLCFTGLRLGEALAITDRDIRGGVIHVEKKISWQPNQPVVEPFTKTERGIRNVPLLDVVSQTLPVFKGYLFSDDGIKPYSKSAFTKRWRKYASETGVSCARHVLRHEFSTIMFDAEIDPKDAAEIMGNDEEIMRRVYTHIRKKRRAKTAEKINSYVNTVYENPANR